MTHARSGLVVSGASSLVGCLLLAACGSSGPPIHAVAPHAGGGWRLGFSTYMVNPCPPGMECNDKNPCTTGDACQNGSCAGTPKTCNTPPSSCYVAAGTCSGGSCSYAYDNGKSCSEFCAKSAARRASVLSTKA